MSPTSGPNGSAMVAGIDKTNIYNATHRIRTSFVQAPDKSLASSVRTSLAVHSSVLVAAVARVAIHSVHARPVVLTWGRGTLINV